MRGPAIGHSSIGRAPVMLTATLILLTGCSPTRDSSEFLKGLASVRSELVAAGFDDAGVHAGRKEYFEHPEESVDIVTIVLLHDSMDADTARKTAATVVWKSVGGYVAGAGSVLIVFGVIALVVLLIVAAPIAVLIRRNLRKKARLSAPGRDRLQGENPGADQPPGPDRDRTPESS